MQHDKILDIENNLACIAEASVYKTDHLRVFIRVCRQNNVIGAEDFESLMNSLSYIEQALRAGKTMGGELRRYDAEAQD